MERIRVQPRLFRDLPASKGKKQVGKGFNDKRNQGLEKKRKELQLEDSSIRRVRFLSDSELSDQERRVICISEEDEIRVSVSSGPTPSALELVSVVTVGSPTKLCTEEEEDEPAFRQLQELLDESIPSGSKMTGMSAVGQKRCRSKSRDRKVCSYDKAIESQEVLNDSDEFQFNIEDVEKEF